MAKRLSSLFSSSKNNDLPQSLGSSQLSSENDGARTPPRGKLTKPMTKSPSDLHLNTRLESADLEPPPMFGNSGIPPRAGRDGRSPVRSDTAGSRQSSGSRPQTPTFLGVPGAASPKELSPGSAKTNKRRSWMSRSDRNLSGSGPEHISCQAWIAGLREVVPYNITKLLNGEPVDDIWDENGDVLVYLYPKTAQKGPSFRVNSQLFADSHALSYLIQPTNKNGSDQAPYIHFEPSSPLAALSIDDRFGTLTHPQPERSAASAYSRPTYGPPEPQVPQLQSVHLPLGLEGDFSVPGAVPSGDDLELVVLYRNFFAFLCGGALVATARQNTLFAIFMSISSILKRLQYGNDKGSSWGTVPWASFSRYTAELRLADVRASREKNIEAILLGNAMKSWPLYAEGFTHAAGRLDDIRSINSPKFDKIPPGIMHKLERAYHDLQNNRLGPLRSKLDNFYFPSMFAGLANSQSTTESKLVRFKEWKAYFMDFRQYTMTQYKRRYGNWPPKASSKKNNFEESGLNRMLIREVYQDFTDLYELLVDRASLTTRTADMSKLGDNAESGKSETVQHILRSVESEYDRSTPPVLPAIPFDVPLFPAFGRLMLAKEAQLAKKLKDNELQETLSNSWNKDSMKNTQWIQDFLEYERKLCWGKTIDELTDIRCGQWLFIYAVLQALPMTVVDARDLQHTEGVEYFLCEAPRGGRPWVDMDDSTSRAWFNVASGGGLVSMPADTIDHSVEGIYRRSHCWTIATRWAEALGPMKNVTQFPAPDTAISPFLRAKPGSTATSPFGSPLLQPVALAPGVPSEQSSGLPRVSSRTSMNLGLEEVAPPAQASRPVSTFNPNITFDNILASQQIPQKPLKKGKK